MNNECAQASSVRQRFQASGTALERKREVKKSPACRATLIAGLVLAALTGDPGQAYSQGHDSLLNGALIGGAVGAASGVAFTYAVRDSDLGVSQYAFGALIFAGIGAGAGAGIDALMSRTSPNPLTRPRRMLIQPAVWHRVGGVLVKWRW